MGDGGAGNGETGYPGSYLDEDIGVGYAGSYLDADLKMLGSPDSPGMAMGAMGGGGGVSDIKPPAVRAPAGAGPKAEQKAPANRPSPKTISSMPNSKKSPARRARRRD